MAKIAIALTFKGPFLDAVLADVDVDLAGRGDLVLCVDKEGSGFERHIAWNFDS